MKKKAYGSGSFGEWIEDEYGMPVYNYTCNQYQLPEEMPLTRKKSVWGDYRNHYSQIGNDRIIGLVSNFGYVKIREDEGGCKFLNDYYPEGRQYAGGFGYFVSGEDCISTFYQEQKNFVRQFGCGYYLKETGNESFKIRQTLMAPFGDDPCLISKVEITNCTVKEKRGAWYEYWGNEVYQISYRPVKYSWKAHLPFDTAYYFRREFAKNFAGKYTAFEKTAKVDYTFLGYHYPEKSAYTDSIWEINSVIRPNVGDKANYEDLHIPSMFVTCLNAEEKVDARFDGSFFFSNQDMLRPTGISEVADGSREDALILSTEMTLKPQETKTLYFLIGYLPGDMKMEYLVAKYQTGFETVLEDTLQEWKKEPITLKIGGEEGKEENWIYRELLWHNYYLRSCMTYDQALGSHVLSQGGYYQYVWGNQCCIRDILQHAVPFIYSRPEIAREIIDYSLKMVDESGWVYNGIAGDGVISDDDPREQNAYGSTIMEEFIGGYQDIVKDYANNGKVPIENRFSDNELWIFWLVTEYVQATKDYDYLNEVKIGYFSCNNRPRTVLEILLDCFNYIQNDIGVGKHGLMRNLFHDWSRVLMHKNYRPLSREDKVNAPHIAESLFNASLAVYCCDCLASLLGEIGHEKAVEAKAFADGQRSAINSVWNGKWIQRAWISDQYGFVGDENEFILEGQPWTLISHVLEEEQAKILIQNIKELVMDPSPIGCAKQRLAPDAAGISHDGWVWWSLNGLLLWGIMPYDNKLAYEEYIKNSLGRHAEVYPNIWFGIWSGPDEYTSFLSEYPGYARWNDNPEIIPSKKRALEGNEDEHEWPCALNFPVGNLHAHAWPMYAAIRFLQPQYYKEGMTLKPCLPRKEYCVSSRLLTYDQRKNSIEIIYAPLKKGVYTLKLDLSYVEERYAHVYVNGEEAKCCILEKEITVTGTAEPKMVVRLTK